MDDDYVCPPMRSRGSTAMSTSRADSHTDSIQIDMSDLVSQPVSFVPRPPPPSSSAPQWEAPKGVSVSPTPFKRRANAAVGLTHPAVNWALPVAAAQQLDGEPRVADLIREEHLRRCHIQTQALQGYDALIAGLVTVQASVSGEVMSHVINDETFERHAITAWHLRELAHLAELHAATVNVAAVSLRETGERRRIQRFETAGRLLLLPWAQRLLRRCIESEEDHARVEMHRTCFALSPLVELSSSEAFVRRYYERLENEDFSFAVILRRYVGAKRVLEHDEHHWRTQLSEAEARERARFVHASTAGYPIALAVSHIRRVHTAAAIITRFMSMVAAKRIARRRLATKQKQDMLTSLADMQSLFVGLAFR